MASGSRSTGRAEHAVESERMGNEAKSKTIEKLASGIPGFDTIARGGLPKGRATLVCGTAGSAKTVFAMQFLVAGAMLGEPGVLVTFEEPPSDLRRNILGFGWDVAALEVKNLVTFVAASPRDDDERDEVMMVGLVGIDALSVAAGVR